MPLSEVQRESARKMFECYKRNGYKSTYQAHTYNDFREWDKERMSALKTMRPEIQKYLAGSYSLSEFRDVNSRLSFANNLWGFTGPSGQMFVNQLAKWSKDSDKTNAQLRESMRRPKSREDAAAKIRAMADYLRKEFPQSKVRFASVPFLLSYFWQIEDPSFAPMHYPNSRQVLEAEGLFEAGEDLAQSYLDFWERYDDLAKEWSHGFDPTKDCKYWFVEHVLWAYSQSQKAETAAPEEEAAASEEAAGLSFPSGPLALIGTWKNDGVDGARKFIKTAGAWASVWDFPIKEAAQPNLKLPFYVYVNVGRGVLRYRMKVAEYQTSRGNEGLTPPWPDLTDQSNKGKHRNGDFIFKTWFKVTGIEDVTPTLNAFDLEPAAPYTRTSRALLNQSTFGYFRLPSGTTPTAAPEPTPAPYSLDDAAKGMFIPKGELAEMVDLLRRKKNVILQGPPGVGKTFVARRLAYALIGAESDRQIGSVQFHQSYSYEDFVQGYRPKKDGAFELTKGIFVRFCEEARQRPEHRFVFIIDEINRGNVSKIFGELMLLIEADKRGPAWKAVLAYGDEDQTEFFVPPNVYLLGLMNTADRSLALVDYALRRRFAFMDLDPRFESAEFEVYLKECGATPALVTKIRSRFAELNQTIEADKDLGRGFRIGHSYFCPDGVARVDGDWYLRVVRREIEPLLREYWFDQPQDDVKAKVSRLLVN